MSVALGQGIGGLEVVEGQSIGGLGVHGEPPLNAGLDWDWQPHATAAAIPASWPTFVRAGTSWALDHENILRTLKAGEMPRPGHRRVEQLLDDSDDLTTASWPIVDLARTDLGGGAVNIQPTTPSSTSWVIRQFATVGLFAGKDYVGSIELRAGSPGEVGKTVKLSLVRNTGTAVSVGRNHTLTAGWVRIATPVLTGLATSTDIRFQINRADSSPFAMSIDVRRPQLEHVSGQSVQIPAVYVDSETIYNAAVTGVRYFTTTNGNTVDGNGVVTEAQGTLIPAATRRGVRLNPARTNFATYSYDLTQWSTSGGGSAVLNAVGIGGVSNRAATVTDDSAADAENILLAVVPSGTGSHVLSIWIKKDSNTSRFPQLQLVGLGFSPAVRIRVNTSTGAWAAHPSGTAPDWVSTARSFGDTTFGWWIFDIGVTTTSTSGGQILIQPTFTDVIDSAGGNNSLTGSIVVGHVQLEAGTFPTSPIPTNGAEVTRLADALNTDAWPSTAWAIAAEILLTDELLTEIGYKGGTIIGSTGASNRILFYGGGGVLYHFQASDAGAATANGLAGKAGQVVRAVVSWDGTTSLAVLDDGAVASAPAAVGYTGEGTIGRMVTNVEWLHGSVRRLRRWRRALTAAEAQRVAQGLA